MTEPIISDARSVIDLAVTSVGPVAFVDPSAAHAIVVPTGYQAQIVTPDELERPETSLPAPKRTIANVTLHDAASLVAYVRHHDEGATVLYADRSSRSIAAILDAPAAGRTAWSEHRAVVALTPSDEWRHWRSADGKLVAQLAFAEHIEAGLDQIVDPPAAEMLEVAQHFQAHRRVEFRSGRRLTSGETQFVYAETVDAKAGQTGEVKVPDQFFLGLRPFEDLDTAYKVRARLRYRLNDGALTLGYVLDRPEVVVQEAFDEVVGQVESALGITAWRGQQP